MKLDSDMTAEAEGVARDRARTSGLVRDALAKARRNRDVLQGVMVDIAWLAALLRAWASGEYTLVPWRTIVMATAALLYLVNPLDLIPDVVFFAGYLDDATVISLVAASLRRDIDRFRNWHASRRPSRLRSATV